MKQIFVRPERCMGCKSCEIACAVEHSKSQNIYGAIAEIPLPVKRLFVESDGLIKMPVLCRHCEDAPCIRACITGSVFKNEQGIVLKDNSRCIGCWSCVMACPFGVTTMDMGQHIAVKCDLCSNRNLPACVDACPTKALALVDVDTLAEETRQAVVLKEGQGR